MAIKQAYILAAGKGTRMGEIGLVLPKILWPAFGMSLLEWQIRYLEKLGVKRIFINVHHCADLIKKFLETIDCNAEVFILKEDVLLGSGGAIHNLLSHHSIDKREPLLLINGDQFLFLNKADLELGLERIARGKVHLFCIHFDKEEYNQVVIKDGHLININKKIDTTEPLITFSGVSFLNLSKIKQHPGVSSFFETVADFKNNSNEISASVVDEVQYIDFGTIDRYLISLVQTKSSKWQSEHQDISTFFNLAPKRQNVEVVKILEDEFRIQLMKNEEVEISYKEIKLKVKIPAFQSSL